MRSLTIELPEGDEWSSFAGADVDAKLRELETAARRIESAIVAATEHVDRTGHHLADGHRTVGNWLMATTNCSRSEALARRRSAALVRQVPEVANEFSAGRVGVAQVRELGEGRVRARIEGVGEQGLDVRAAELAGRETDSVDDDGVDRDPLGTGVVVRRGCAARRAR